LRTIGKACNYVRTGCAGDRLPHGRPPQYLHLCDRRNASPICGWSRVIAGLAESDNFKSEYEEVNADPGDDTTRVARYFSTSSTGSRSNLRLNPPSGCELLSRTRLRACLKSPPRRQAGRGWASADRGTLGGFHASAHGAVERSSPAPPRMRRRSLEYFQVFGASLPPCIRPAAPA